MGMLTMFFLGAHAVCITECFEDRNCLKFVSYLLLGVSVPSVKRNSGLSMECQIASFHKITPINWYEFPRGYPEKDLRSGISENDR